MSDNTVRISDLSPDVQKQIPLSIRLAKDEYQLDELPVDVQNIILNYFKQQVVDDTDSQLFDVKLDVDAKGDLAHIISIKDLVLEYLRTYFGVTDGYPFDPKFSNNLKKYLHKRGTSVFHQLINEEVTKIIDVIKSDLGVLIEIENIDIQVVGNQSTIKIDILLNSQKHTLTVVY